MPYELKGRTTAWRITRDHRGTHYLERDYLMPVVRMFGPWAWTKHIMQSETVMNNRDIKACEQEMRDLIKLDRPTERVGVSTYNPDGKLVT